MTAVFSLKLTNPMFRYGKYFVFKESKKIVGNKKEGIIYYNRKCKSVPSMLHHIMSAILMCQENGKQLTEIRIMKATGSAEVKRMF